MQLKYLLSLSILFSYSILAQQSPNYHNAVPQSPDVAGVARSVEVPVNYYTGIPQIQVPFYQYGGGGKNLNFSVALNYFAGGIKVNEEASSVGLGWSLATGGVITRQIRGLPDDFSPYGFALRTQLVDDANTDKYEKETWDPMADVFQFNISSAGGRFYLGKGQTSNYIGGPLTQRYVFVPGSNMRLTTQYGTIAVPNSTISTGGINSFSITSEDGTQYVFDECELTKEENPLASQNNPSYFGLYFPSSWFLSKIIAPYYTDTISIEYDTYFTSKSYSLPETAINERTDNNHEIEYKTQNVLLSRYNKRISKVNLPDKSTIEFVYDTKSRCDAASSENALKQILLKKGSNIKKGIGFEYIYSTAYGFINGDECEKYSYPNKRMFLNKATEFAENSTLPPYKFDYENEVFLPAIDNKGQDVFGFYNGVSNTRLIPPTSDGLIAGANRSSNFNFAKAGSLKKITYPAGAYSLFEYEANKKCKYSVQNISVSTPDNYTQTILINQQQTQRVKFWGGWEPEPDVEGDLSNYDQSLETRVFIEIHEPVNNNLVDTFSFSYADIQANAFRELNLQNGSYSMTSSIFLPNSNARIANLKVTWSNDVIQGSGNEETGGLRIKRIITGDGLNAANDKVTTYKYETTSGLSSGFTMEVPTFDYTFHKSIQHSFYTEVKNFAIRSSAIANNVTYPQGAPIGYSKVEVFNGDEINFTSKTAYEFTSFKDLYDNDPASFNEYYNNSTYPYPPKDKADFYLGLPKTITIFDGNGNVKKRSDNFYNLYVNHDVFNPNFKSLKVGHSSESYYLNGTVNIPYQKSFYTPLRGYVQLTKSTNTAFFDDGSSTTSTVSNEYHLNDPTLVTKTISDYNKKLNQKIEIRFYYPLDYTLGGLMDSIRYQTVFFGFSTTPISSETWLTENGTPIKLLDASVTELRRFDNVVRPYKSYKLLSENGVLQSLIGQFNQNVLIRNTNLIKPLTEYNNFHIRGFNTQATDLLTGRSSSQIIDSYDYSVLATAKNASLNEIAYTSFETGEPGNWKYKGTIISNNDATTGSKYFSFSGANSYIMTVNPLHPGIYILSFYSKNGNCVVGGQLLKQELNATTGWTYNEYKISIDYQTLLLLEGSGYVDELKLCPENAEMTTYTYLPLTGVSSVCNSTNQIIKYDYDVYGRLKAERDINGNILKMYEYGMRQ